MMMDVIRMLTRKRILDGKSQSDIGAKIGVSRQAVTSWEDGVSLPSTDNLFKWAYSLNVSIDAKYNDK